MDEYSQKSRCSAVHEFMDALDELGLVLQGNLNSSEAALISDKPDPGASSIIQAPGPELAEVERWFGEAVQDIEQFMAGQSGR